MRKKVVKLVLWMLFVNLVIWFYFGDALVAKTITYPEFEAKLLNGEFERISLDKDDGAAFIYERGSKAIYKLQLFSFEDTEALILQQQKAEVEAGNESVLIYHIANHSGGFWTFVISFILGYWLVRLVFFFSRTVMKIKGFGKSITVINGKPTFSGGKKKDKNGEDDAEDEENNDDKSAENSPFNSIEKALESMKKSIEEMDGRMKFKKEEKTNVKFKDVIGLSRELEELQDATAILQNPEKYRQIGAELPRGILLYGKSGVGKTLIARAIAGEAEVPFFQISASAVQNMYVGGTEANIRNLFKEAKAVAPSVIFIDEFDSIALKRYGDHSNRFSASFLNQLLSCMDGFESMDGVLVIAATNHYEQLDEAVIRRGRFDRHIYIHEPDKKARKELFEYYSHGKNVDLYGIIDNLVDRTVGFTGSDIKTMMNEAALLAARNGREEISESDLEEAFRKIAIGAQSTRESSAENKKRTSFHEAGHALAAILLGEKVMEASIIPRGNAGGYSLNAIDEDKALTAEEMIKRVKIALAGRVAEKIVYGNVSAGASSDLQQATGIIYNMYLRYGMSADDEVGLVLTGNPEMDKHLVSQSAQCMQSDIKRYYNETKSMLDSKKDMLHAFANLLYEKEVLNEEDIQNFVGSWNN